MTKFESLIKCRNHWQWLAITGSDDKKSYEPSYGWMYACACCEYTSKLEKYDMFWDCSKCPLTGYAWEKLERKTSFCDHDQDSYFKLWFQGSSKKERQFYAQKMVDACNRAIEDMIIKGEIV